MTDTFPFETMATSGKVVRRKLKAQYGDGYSQATLDGINNRVTEWTFTAVGSPAEIDVIAEWLDAHPLSFLWTPPHGAEAKYECDEYSINAMDSYNSQISGVFKQVFR